jgi:RNA polymerase sigma factor (sigma-70 family)
MSAFSALKADPDDRAAFTAWYRETYPALFVTAHRATAGDRAAAEDLCQEAILAFMTRGGLAKVGTEGEALAYLRRSVVNAYIDGIRRNRREPPGEAYLHAIGSAEEGVDFEQQYHRLWAALDAAEQQLLRMMLDGHSLGEMAEKLGLSYSNTGVRVHRIRNKIRELGIFGASP